MAPSPVRHPLRDDEESAARRRAIAAHPAGTARAAVRRPRPGTVPAPTRPGTTPSAAGAPVPAAASRDARTTSEDGSMTTEYGLIVVVGATACSLVIQWASGGAIFELLGGVLEAAKGLVGF